MPVVVRIRAHMSARDVRNEVEGAQPSRARARVMSTRVQSPPLLVTSAGISTMSPGVQPGRFDQGGQQRAHADRLADGVGAGGTDDGVGDVAHVHVVALGVGNGQFDGCAGDSAAQPGGQRTEEAGRLGARPAHVDDAQHGPVDLHSRGRIEHDA